MAVMLLRARSRTGHVLCSAKGGILTLSAYVGQARPFASTSQSGSGSADDVVHSLPLNLRVRNMLHTASQLFSPGAPLASPTWQARTESAAERLAEAARHRNAKRPLRIGIVGDVLTGTHTLIDLTLDDPMAEYARATKADADAALKGLQARRRKDNGQEQKGTAIRIRYGDEVFDGQGLVTLPAAWLRDNNIEFLELLQPADDALSHDKLYECDALFFVTDEVTLAAHSRFGADLRTGNVLRLLRYFAQKPGTRVLINHSGTQLMDPVSLEKGVKDAISDEAFAALSSQQVRSSGPVVIHASLELVRRANDALRQALAEAGPTTLSASAWDHFTTLFSSSGFADVRSAIARKDTNGETEPESAEADALRTATFVLRRALDQALFCIQADLEHAQHAQGAAEVLRRDVESERTKLFNSIFEPPDNQRLDQAAFHQRTGDRSRSVDAASKDAWGVVESTFSARLPWWKVLWKVDDVRAETEAAIERGFAKDLEQRLMVQTGRLVSVAERLQRRVRGLFHELDDAQARKATGEGQGQDGAMTRNPFTSPLLLNELRKYPLDAIEAKLQEDLLTQPITKRRAQLLTPGGPMGMLCRRAQRSTLATVGLTGSTGLFSLTGGLAGSPFGAEFPATLQLIAMQPSTAAASFAFVSVASLWVMQSRWTRAKRRFWRDWERITDGLDDDLQVRAQGE